MCQRKENHFGTIKISQNLGVSVVCSALKHGGALKPRGK